MAAFIPIQDIFNNSYTFFFSWHVVLKKITEAKKVFDNINQQMNY